MKKTLGIIGAEQQEIDLLLERLLLEKTVKKAGLQNRNILDFLLADFKFG